MSSYLSLTDDTVAFPTLADPELAVLETLGIRRSVTVGEYLYREGDTTYDFYVIRSGAAEIVVRSDGEERIITRHGPGQFLGCLLLVTSGRALSSELRQQSAKGRPQCVQSTSTLRSLTERRTRDYASGSSLPPARAQRWMLAHIAQERVGDVPIWDS